MDANMLHRHGISTAVYEQILDRQEHKCAICGHPEHANRRLRVDHDDEGHIRGLLCDKCHDWLIRANQDMAVVRRAESYLANPPVFSYLGHVGKWANRRKRALPKPLNSSQGFRIVRENLGNGGTIIRVIQDGSEKCLPKNFPIYPGT